MSHHFEQPEAFDPYAAPDGGHDNAEGEVEDYYREGKHGRYNDFFVIPNEQYDRADAQDSPSHGA